MKKENKVTEITLMNALTKGGMPVKISIPFMGAGNIICGQAVKGCLFLAAEILYLLYMVMDGFSRLAMLTSLGSKSQVEVWDEAKQVYLYEGGDRSVLILLYGVAVLFITVMMIWLWSTALQSAFKAERLRAERKHVRNFREDLRSLLNDNLHILLMSPSLFFIFTLTVLPLIFMICMAFTNYSKIGNHLMLFDWVGLENFRTLFDSGSIIGSTFWSVLAWTVIWAFFATFTNYFSGMILALIINRKNTKAKGFWRFCFVLSIAVPQFVMLMIMNIFR